MSEVRRAFRFRLYPTAEQDVTFRQFAGVTRLVYNLALEQRRDFWRQYRAATGGNFNFASQGRQVTELRREFDWIGAVPSSCLHQALRDLDRAFANFFAGRSRHPTPRRKVLNDSFRIQAKETAVRRINGRWSEVRLPNLGWVRFRDTRAIAGRCQSVTVSRGALGWHVIFACEIEHEAPANDNASVGIDRGIAISLALSNGETFSLPDMAALDRRKRGAQRALARCKRGSRRRLKRLRRVARLSAKIARARADWQHKVSRNIADRFGFVAIEDLKISNMSASGPGKRGLNRSIMNQGWGAFADKLAYKLEERGGMLVKVDPRLTSQECSACGTVDKASRESQARFACRHCGFAANADHNAAVNILRRSTSQLPVEGRGCAPDEAGTMLEAA
jgi:putative transposase